MSNKIISTLISLSTVIGFVAFVYVCFHADRNLPCLSEECIAVPQPLKDQ